MESWLAEGKRWRRRKLKSWPLGKSEWIYNVSNMKYRRLSKTRAIGRNQSISRSFSKGQSTKAKNSPISFSRAYMGRLSLLGNKDQDGRPADPARSKYDVTKGEYAAQVK
jgi:hypothetical protein